MYVKHLLPATYTPMNQVENLLEKHRKTLVFGFVSNKGPRWIVWGILKQWYRWHTVSEQQQFIHEVFSQF